MAPDLIQKYSPLRKETILQPDGATYSLHGKKFSDA